MIAEALGATFVALVSDPEDAIQRLEVEAWRDRVDGSEARLLAATPGARAAMAIRSGARRSLPG